MQDILEFETKYKGSEEERQDVIQLYVQHQGNMDAITASTMCCSQEDEPRLCSIIRAAIEAEEVTSFPAFTQESDKKKKSRRKRVRNVLASKPQNLHSSLNSLTIVGWPEDAPISFLLRIPMSVMWLQWTFQAAKEQQEAEEMQKEMGLGEEDDSLVMMLKVTKANAHVWSGTGAVCFFYLKPSCHSCFPAKTEVQRAEFQQFPLWPGSKILQRK